MLRDQRTRSTPRLPNHFEHLSAAALHAIHHRCAVCSPKDLKRLQPAIDSRVRDLQSQIIGQAT